VALTVLPRAAAAEDQSWLANAATVAIGEGAWRLTVTQELRSRGLEYGDVYFHNGAVGVARKLKRDLTVGVAYKREEVERRGFELRENRLMLDGGWGRELASRWRFDVRMRNELRFFESGGAEDDLRVRLRFRLRTERAVAGLPVEPFAWTELFESLRWSGMFERNRLGVGALVRVRPQLGVQLYYLRQDTDGGATVQGFVSGLDLRF